LDIMLEPLTAPVTDLIARHLGLEPARVEGLYAPPGKGFAADLALPCFQLAPLRKVPPPKLAAEIAKLIEGANLGVRASAAGPFVNLTFEPSAVAQLLMPPLADDPRVALRSSLGEGKTVCIDFSGPNIAKHFAFHHLRGNVLGNALSKCYAATSHKVVRINFLGDWGTAFGRLIAGFRREKLTRADVEAAPNKVTFLNDLYVRISQVEKSDSAVGDEARSWSKKLEDGDSEARDLWQLFRDASLSELQKLYDLLDIQFDSVRGEAYYADKVEVVVQEIERRGLAKVDKGATIVDLSAFGLEKPALVRRSDGGTFYSMRDLAAADDRYREFAFDRSLYVVAAEQSLHFQEWFSIAKLLERPYAERLHHVAFGLVLMWNDETGGWGKSSTRQGGVMMLADVLAEAIDRARGIVAEKSPELSDVERETIASAVGVGATVFNALKVARNNDVKFRFEDALSMQGETGPYLQYAHARLCSIERKFEQQFGVPSKADHALLTREEEKGVLLSIARLRSRLERVVELDEPSILAQALLALASSVASWLTAGSQDASMRVLSADVALGTARLALVRAARGALGEGLRLLGLSAPERM
jgi:arginyl-tRNA synthetase